MEEQERYQLSVDLQNYPDLREMYEAVKDALNKRIPGISNPAVLRMALADWLPEQLERERERIQG